jgi:hypothetical protein
MVKGALVERYLQAGQRFLELLDGAGIETTGAMWLYEGASEGWTLLLALPVVTQSGPLVAYQQIQKVFRPHVAELDPLEFDDITVKRPQDAPFSLLEGVVQTDPRAVTPRRFSGQRVDNYWIEDTWLYRMVWGEAGEYKDLRR